MKEIREVIPTYLQVNMLKAKPMTRGDYNKYRGWEIPADEDPLDLGYLCMYANGHNTWMPKEVFEHNNLPIGTNDSEISLDRVQDFIEDGVILEGVLDNNTFLLSVVAKTGQVYTGCSAAIDEDKFDVKECKQNCLDVITNRVWRDLGFVLRWARFGLKGNRNQDKGINHAFVKR